LVGSEQYNHKGFSVLLVKGVGITTFVSISDDCVSKLRKSGATTECFGVGKTDAADSTHEPLVLLKRYASPSKTSSSDNTKKMTGIILWLEEATPPRR
jgi:hypothetical protein